MAHLSNENKLMETIPEKLLDLLDKDFETTVLRMFKEQKKKDKTKRQKTRKQSSTYDFRGIANIHSKAGRNGTYLK